MRKTLPSAVLVQGKNPYDCSQASGSSADTKGLRRIRQIKKDNKIVMVLVRRFDTPPKYNKGLHDIHKSLNMLSSNIEASSVYEKHYIKHVRNRDRVHAAETLSHTHKITKIKQEGTQGFYVVRIPSKSYVHGLQPEFILTHKDYKLVIQLNPLNNLSCTLAAHISYLHHTCIYRRV
ncbi:hypothetical protein LXL04_037711 [Taraxacum kok-saghyz]